MVWSISNELLLVFSLLNVCGVVVVNDELFKSEGEDDKYNDDAVVVDGSLDSSGNIDNVSVKKYFIINEM